MPSERAKRAAERIFPEFNVLDDECDAPSAKTLVSIIDSEYADLEGYVEYVNGKITDDYPKGIHLYVATFEEWKKEFYKKEVQKP